MYIVRIIVISFLLPFSINALNNPQRNCIILLDHHDNDNVGRSVWFLMSRIQSVIAEQTTPLLLSASLWNSFIERRMHFEQHLQQENSPLYKIYNLYITINKQMENLSHQYNTDNPDPIQNKKLIIQSINKKFYNNKKNISPAHYQLLLNYLTPFDPQDWSIYTNNGCFYLLIPQTYRRQNSPLGFNINALQEVIDPNDTAYTYLESRTRQSIVNALPDFFLTHNDFTNTDMPYAWNIIVAGHGGSRYLETNDNEAVTWTGEPVIADLSVQEFTDMLLFFHTNVHTNFFHYASCYAAGNHIALIFSNNNQPYNFTIMCDNLTDCATYCKWKTLLPSHEKKFLTTADISYDSTKNCWQLPLTPTYYWDNFFKGISSIDFSIESMDHLQEIMTSITYPIIANIPLLCLPNTSNFFPLQASDVIKIDNQLIALTKTENDCISLNGVRTILVESSVIIPTIELNHREPLRIISIKPDNAVHYIKKLKSTCYIDLPSAFWQAQYQRYNKTFILDECILPYASDFDYTKTLPQTQKLQLKNVIILQHKDHYMRIFFTLNDKAMMIIAHKPGQEEELEKATIQEIVTMTEPAQKKYEEYYISLKEIALQ